MPGSFLLPLLLGLPLLGAIFVMCTPKSEEALHRGLGLAVTLITFFVSLFTLSFFNPKADGFQLVFDAEWIPALGAHWADVFAGRESASLDLSHLALHGRSRKARRLALSCRRDERCVPIDMR